MSDTNATQPGLKQRVVHETRDFALIFIYLVSVFGAFTVYRRLVLSQAGISYLHYGIAIINAAVFAKVILVCQYLRFTRVFNDRPLIIPTLYKTALFTIFMLAFSILEFGVKGLCGGKDWSEAMDGILDMGRNEFFAQTLMVMFSLVPFFAIRETGRVLGKGRLNDLFFHKRPAD